MRRLGDRVMGKAGEMSEADRKIEQAERALRDARSAFAQLRSGAPPRADVSIEDVTPATAAQWLASNTHNRVLNPRLVAQYARAMRDGRWRLNGDVIRFGSDGVLLDGQHRLSAIVASGVEIAAVVVRGLSPDVMPTIDRQKQRTAADTLSLMGHSSAPALAAALGVIKSIDGRTMYYTRGLDQSIPDEMAELIALHPRMPDSVRVVHAAVRRLRLGHAAAAALHCMAHERGMGREADAFFSALDDGIGLLDEDPRLMLRNAMLSEQSRSSRGLSSPIRVAYMLKAWNAFSEGRKIRSLRIKVGGTHQEAYPYPVFPARR